MIKISTVIGTSIVAVLIVSMLGMEQKGIQGSQLMEPVASDNLLDECPNMDTADCLALFGNLDSGILAVKEIKVLENDEEVDLGFNVKKYLPKNFNPYSTSEAFEQIEDGKPIKIDDIEVLENDGDIDLGFNVKDYLPKGFNPYASR